MQILGHASFMATIPDEVKEKVKAYGKGLLSAWAPQQLILDHPVSIHSYGLERWNTVEVFYTHRPLAGSSRMADTTLSRKRSPLEYLCKHILRN